MLAILTVYFIDETLVYVGNIRVIVLIQYSWNANHVVTHNHPWTPKGIAHVFGFRGMNCDPGLTTYFSWGCSSFLNLVKLTVTCKRGTVLIQGQANWKSLSLKHTLTGYVHVRHIHLLLDNFDEFFHSNYVTEDVTDCSDSRGGLGGEKAT